MSYKLTSHLCPTCGHDKGKPQDFEIPTVPVVEMAALDDLKKAIAAIPKSTELPPNLAETLEKVAQAGQHMETIATSWEAQQKAEAETGGHSVPTPEDIEHYHTCPNCAPAWQKIWDGIAEEARKGYVPAAEAQEAITEVARQLTGAKGRA